MVAGWRRCRLAREWIAPGGSNSACEYLAAAKRLLAPYQHARWIAERIYTTTDEKGKISTFPWRYESRQSGPLRTFREWNKDREEVYLARPEHSFRAERQSATEAWQIREDPSVGPERAYQWIAREIDQLQPVYQDTLPLLSLADVAPGLVNPLALKVTRLERFTEKGRRLIRIELEDCPPGHPIYRNVTLQLSADDDSAVHDESVDQAGKNWRADSSYERQTAGSSAEVRRGTKASRKKAITPPTC